MLGSWQATEKAMACPTDANFCAANFVLASRDDTQSLHHRNPDGGADGHGVSQRTSLWPARVLRPELPALLPGPEGSRRFPEPGGAFRVQPGSGEHANAPAGTAKHAAGAPHLIRALLGSALLGSALLHGRSARRNVQPGDFGLLRVHG